jgi:hypothetical protein
MSCGTGTFVLGVHHTLSLILVTSLLKWESCRSCDTLTCKLTLLIWHYKHGPLKGISDHKGLKVDVAYFVYYLHRFGSHVVWNKQRNKIDAQFMDVVTKYVSNRIDKDTKGPRIQDNHVTQRWKSREPFNTDIFFRKHTWTPPPRGCWNQFCELRWGWISHKTCT